MVILQGRNYPPKVFVCKKMCRESFFPPLCVFGHFGRFTAMPVVLSRRWTRLMHSRLPRFADQHPKFQEWMVSPLQPDLPAASETAKYERHANLSLSNKPIKTRHFLLSLVRGWGVDTSLNSPTTWVTRFFFLAYGSLASDSQHSWRLLTVVRRSIVNWGQSPALEVRVTWVVNVPSLYIWVFAH